MSGRIHRPLKALRSEFTCVICLDFIKNTRVVMECLHRFCEDCIEKSLRLGKKECPICRVPVPSRRSLAPDPNFDRLIASIFGNLTELQRDEEEFDKRASPEMDEHERAVGRKRRRVGHYRSLPVQQIEKNTSEVETPPIMTEVVEIRLQRHPSDDVLDGLALPYVRLSGNATVATIRKFLQVKIDKPEAPIHIYGFENNYYVRIPFFLTLDEVADRFSEDESSIINLYYRLDENLG